ncbi:MAG TPA: MBL fold metallo-hydrolase [Solirubrobacteraceae bacterium]|jgi:glyoxylase-like metal-dependent hydrolase (beta-lactamase superfamily II)|nr:MBL fold metallo-hydrolase [Solirubrobacteraceae bacterium]
MPALSVERLDGGALVLQSRLWATNSVLVPAGEDCLVCDPSIFPDEIDQIRAAASRYGHVHLPVTHTDFDHVCGIPAFAGATVVAGATTAAAIGEGRARRKLDQSGREWGTRWDGDLRVDVVVGRQPVRCGDVSVCAIECSGHIADGSAFVVPERRLLLAGDYLSAACHPIVFGSLDGAVAAIERLLGAIGEEGIETVVPGHGPVLDGRRARRIGRNDIDYLRSLQRAAAEAVRVGASVNAALLMVRAVAPPRRARPDFEAFDWLSANARRALAEAGHPAYSGSGPGSGAPVTS